MLCAMKGGAQDPPPGEPLGVEPFASDGGGPGHFWHREQHMYPWKGMALWRGTWNAWRKAGDMAGQAGRAKSRGNLSAVGSCLEVIL